MSAKGIHAINNAIAAALGLPKNIKSFELRCAVNEIPACTVEMLILDLKNDVEQIKTKMVHYELREVEAPPETISPELLDKIIDKFDLTGKKTPVA
jgi:hypothetical protein